MTMMVQSGRFGGGNSFLGILTTLGHSTNLKLCLDAGDLLSYPGSGQTWFDTSGQGNDFFRGTTSGAEASDPTFNGTAGDLLSTTYWSFDGSDFFTEASAAMDLGDPLIEGHRYTVMAVFYPSTLVGSTVGLFSDGGDLAIWLDGNEKLAASCEEIFGGGLSTLTTNSFTQNQWNFAALSIDENGGAAGSFIKLNTTAKFTFEATRGAPGSWTPGVYLIADTSTFLAFPSGWRLAGIMFIYGTALTEAEVDAVYSAVNLNRFPLAA